MPSVVCSRTRASGFRRIRRATCSRGGRTMTVQTVAHDFHAKVSAKVRLAGEGVDRYRVFTPFLFEDGDHLSIVLKRERGAVGCSPMRRIRTCTSPMILMNGTCSAERGSRSSPTRCPRSRSKIAMASWSLPCPMSGTGMRCTPSFRRCSRSAPCPFLSRERVRSTFMEDFRDLLSEVAPEERRDFDWERSRARSQRDVPRGLPHQRHVTPALRPRPRE